MGSAPTSQDTDRFRASTTICWTPVRRGRRAAGEGGTGPAARRRAKVPLILSGGLTPENVADGVAAVAPVRGRRRPGVEAGPGVKDPTSCAPSWPPPPRTRRCARDRRRAPLRPLRRPVRPRDADAGARRARGGVGRARADAGYHAELDSLLRDYVGRPTPLYRARRLSEAAGRPVWLKREDLMHTGAHKINNAIGQACSPGAWASRGSSPRPARASTAWPPRPRARCSGSSASSTWARRTCAASSPTCSACACWARP